MFQCSALKVCSMERQANNVTMFMFGVLYACTMPFLAQNKGPHQPLFAFTSTAVGLQLCFLIQELATFKQRSETSSKSGGNFSIESKIIPNCSASLNFLGHSQPKTKNEKHRVAIVVTLTSPVAISTQYFIQSGNPVTTGHFILTVLMQFIISP